MEKEKQMYDVVNYLEENGKMVEIRTTFDDFKNVFSKVNKDLESLWNGRVPYPWVLRIEKKANGEEDGKRNT